MSGLRIYAHFSFSNLTSSPTILFILFNPISTPWIAYLWTALSMFSGRPKN
jgi:hypothetical protein